MSIDLSGVKSFVENSLMDDECIITRDASGTTNDTWDPVTGTYTPGVGDPEEIYNDKCWFSGTGNQPNDDPQGGVPGHVEVYYLNIPLGAPEIIDGDIVECISSLRMSQLEGKTFIAKVLQMGTFKVKQKVRLHRASRVALR